MGVVLGIWACATLIPSTPMREESERVRAARLGARTSVMLLALCLRFGRGTRQPRARRAERA